MAIREFKIDSTTSGERLDKWLTAKLNDLSRAQIQKIIKSETVLVNNRPAKVHAFLKDGDVITVKKIKNKEKRSSSDIGKNRDLNIPVVFADKNFIVVDKPAGLVVHPDNVHKNNTLIDEVIKKYPEVAKIGADPARPGIVHRIDKDVSGLLIIARSEAGFESLKKQFRERTIKKEYTALVYGHPPKNEGVIDFPIARTGRGLMAARPKNVEGKEALTEYEIIKKFTHFSLLKIKLLTGRTHQIRVHLKAIGHPIVGDKLYKTKKLKETVACRRVFLHASLLGWRDLNNDWKEFSSPLPQELNYILKILK
ncbi:MAG: RluA family pseudouridine synthase [Patescibacteria group bacterium]|nr:RluA family pseudouridine synthase [Patescibacteria group bacterium]MDD5490996.1 RluA family pseudouridine synthase [Patescibacteria group bacterium]